METIKDILMLFCCAHSTSDKDKRAQINTNIWTY